MPLRRLPDGSVLNTETGDLSGTDPRREALGRMLTQKAGGHVPAQGLAGVQMPVPNKGQQIVPVAQAGNTVVIRPRQQELRLNPFELGLGAMSDTSKKILLTGLIVGGAFVAVWVNSKLRGKSK